jgi:peroxiredoxin 2/4
MKKLFLVSAICILVSGVIIAQESNKIPLIGSKAPSFSAHTTNGKLTFPDDYGKSWKVLFSHPQDFTPVCSSELLELAYMQDEFNKLDVELAIISTDNVETHNMWKAHLEEIDYKGREPRKLSFQSLMTRKQLLPKNMVCCMSLSAQNATSGACLLSTLKTLYVQLISTQWKLAET